MPIIEKFVWARDVTSVQPRRDECGAVIGSLVYVQLPWTTLIVWARENPWEVEEQLQQGGLVHLTLDH